MTRRSAEMKCYGWNACDALFQHRRDDIVRVYVSEERLSDCGRLLKWCASRRKAYHVVADDELERVAGSVHHEGITVLAKVPRILDGQQAVRHLERMPGAVAGWLLDDVQNPHNVGSIARTSAHFGIGLMTGVRGRTPTLSGSMFRTAQGACEHVQFAEVESPVRFCRELRAKGFSVAATSSHGGQDLFAGELPSRVVFVLGNEVHGVSRQVAAEADVTIAIPGTGLVESLNVAVAAALLAGEFWRRYRAEPVDDAVGR